MLTTSRLGLSYIASSQAQKHITANETFRRLDTLVQMNVRSAVIKQQPEKPSEGDAFILPHDPVGSAWSDYSETMIAVFQNGAWHGITAQTGWRSWVMDAGELRVFDGSSWISLTAGASTEDVVQFGINTNADPANRLAVKADNILFSHDDVTPGSGNIQIKCNKKNPSDNASLLFQSGYRGRAEFGLTGDDNIRLKVSSDGAAFRTAVVFNADTGRAGFLEQSDPVFPLDIRAGTVRAETINSRSISPAGIRVQTTSGSSGFMVTNTNASLPDSDSADSVFQFFYPFNSGGNSKYKVFRIAKGTPLADTFWINVDGGAVFGTPAGGDKGGGAINAEKVYDDNTLLSCYVFDQVLDGHIDTGKWDEFVPISKTRELKARRHQPMRQFSARIGSTHDPLTLDGYAAHWREKRHLTSMPNETDFDIRDNLTTGEWIQRLVETVEIQAILIEALNQRTRHIVER